MDRPDQHVSLPTAAALVYFALTGRQPDVSPRTNGIVCDVAHALSMLSSIYTSPTPMPQELPPAQLIGAIFEQGARVLVCADGTEHRNLTILRKDMEAAIVLLRQCGFERRWRTDKPTVRRLHSVPAPD